MQTYTNTTGVPLSVAVFLSHDSYDYVPDAISATALMRPIRQQILIPRVPPEQQQIDILGLSKSRMGTAIHTAIEDAWVNGHYKEAMKKLGYPQKIIDRVVVNPEGELPKNAIPVYMEKRSFKSIAGKTISGKFDFVAEGRLEDFKSTSTFTWTNGTKDEDYPLQGSIYRWLNPDIITQDHMAIQFFFWDWMPSKANDPAYPNKPVEQKLYKLFSLADTEQFIMDKLAQFDRYKNKHEQELPRCNDKELWRKPPVFKYYRSGKIGPRSTKNFDTAYEAQQKLVADGGKGLVVEVPGQVVACKYCPAFAVCTQKDEYIADGSLQL